MSTDPGGRQEILDAFQPGGSSRTGFTEMASQRLAHLRARAQAALKLPPLDSDTQPADAVPLPTPPPRRYASDSVPSMSPPASPRQKATSLPAPPPLPPLLPPPNPPPPIPLPLLSLSASSSDLPLSPTSAPAEPLSPTPCPASPTAPTAHTAPASPSASTSTTNTNVIESIGGAPINSKSLPRAVQQLIPDLAGRPEAYRKALVSFLKLLLGPSFSLLPAFHYVLSGLQQMEELEDIAQTLLVLAVHYDRHHALFHRLIEAELAGISDSSTLFRGNTVVTKMLSELCRQFGGKYLEDVLMGPITFAYNYPHPTEVQASRLNSRTDDASTQQMQILSAGGEQQDEQEQTITEHAANLIIVADRFISAFEETVELCPRPIRLVCRQLAELIAGKFPGNRLSSVGGLIFLRFLCPAVVAPDNASLSLPFKIAASSRRLLVLVSKVLQNVSNGIFTFYKEQPIPSLDNYLKSVHPRLMAAFERLIDTPMPQELRSAYVVGADMSLVPAQALVSASPPCDAEYACISFIAAFCRKHLHKLAKAVLTAPSQLTRHSAVDIAGRSGYLKKLGGNLKTWRTRWFILKGRLLYYYSSADSAEPLGVVDLETVTVQRHDDKADEDARGTFALVTARRQYELKAKSDIELNAWIHAITQAQISYAQGGAQQGRPASEDSRNSIAGRSMSADSFVVVSPPDSPTSPLSTSPPSSFSPGSSPPTSSSLFPPHLGSVSASSFSSSSSPSSSSSCQVDSDSPTRFVTSIELSNAPFPTRLDSAMDIPMRAPSAPIPFRSQSQALAGWVSARTLRSSTQTCELLDSDTGAFSKRWWHLADYSLWLFNAEPVPARLVQPNTVWPLEDSRFALEGADLRLILSDLQPDVVVRLPDEQAAKTFARSVKLAKLKYWKGLRKVGGDLHVLFPHQHDTGGATTTAWWCVAGNYLLQVFADEPPADGATADTATTPVIEVPIVASTRIRIADRSEVQLLAPPAPTATAPSPRRKLLGASRDSVVPRETEQKHYLAVEYEDTTLLVGSDNPMIVLEWHEMLRRIQGDFGNDQTSSSPSSSSSTPSQRPTLRRTASLRHRVRGGSFNNEEVSVQGYLSKRGLNNRAFKKRWFVLCNSFLLYFENQTRSIPLGEIPLQVAVFRQSETSQVEFVIETPERVFYLEAASENNMHEWMHALKQAKADSWKKAAQSNPDLGSGKTASASGVQRKGKSRIGTRPLNQATAVPAISSSHVHEGWLEKRGGRTKGWKLRWFSLQHGVLHYFKNPQDREACGTISLADASCSQITFDADERPNFALTTRHRVYFIRAETNREALQWVAQLQSGAGTPAVEQVSAAPATQGATQKQGFLWKQGAKVRNWKRRWFVLRGAALEYYCNAGDSEQLGSIVLQNCSINFAPESLKRPFCWQISSRHRNYYLSAEDQFEMASWMEVINAAKEHPLDEADQKRAKLYDLLSKHLQQLAD